MMRRLAVLALISVILVAKAAPAQSVDDFEADDLDSWKKEFESGLGGSVAAPEAVASAANDAAASANPVPSGVASADEPVTTNESSKEEEAVEGSSPVIVESLASAADAEGKEAHEETAAAQPRRKPAVQPAQTTKARVEIVRRVATKPAVTHQARPTCDKFDVFRPDQTCCRDKVSVSEYLTAGLSVSELETSHEGLVEAEERLRSLLKKAKEALKHKCDLDASCSPLDRSKDKELAELVAETKKVDATHPKPDTKKADALRARAAEERAEAEAVAAKAAAEAEAVKEEGLFVLNNATAHANAVRTEAHAMLQDAIQRVKVAEEQAAARRRADDTLHDRAAVRHKQKMMALAEEEVQRKRLEAIQKAYATVDKHVLEMEAAERKRVSAVADKTMKRVVEDRLQDLTKQRAEAVEAIEDAVAEGRGMTRAEEKRVADALRRVTVRVTDEEHAAAKAAETAQRDAAKIEGEKKEVEAEMKEGEAKMTKVVKKMKETEAEAAAAQKALAEKELAEMEDLVSTARRDAKAEVRAVHAEHEAATKDLLKEEDDIKRRAALQSERLEERVKELQANYTAEVEAERLEGEATRTQLRREALEDRERSEQYAQLMEKKFEFEVKEQHKEERAEFDRELEAEREREHETIEEMRKAFEEEMAEGQAKAKAEMEEMAQATDGRLQNMERAVHELRDGMEQALSTVRAREAQLAKRENADRLHEQELEAELEEARGEGNAVEEMQRRAAAAEEEARRAEDTAAQKRAALDESIRQLGLVGATGAARPDVAPAPAKAEEEEAAVEGDASASVNTELQQAEADEQAAVDRAQAVTSRVDELAKKLEAQRAGVQAQLERDTSAMDAAVEKVRKQSARTNEVLAKHEESVQASAEEIAARTKGVVENADSAHERMNDVVDVVKRTSEALDAELKAAADKEAAAAAATGGAATGAAEAVEEAEEEEETEGVDMVVPPVTPATGSVGGGDATSGSGFAFSPVEKEAADKRAREEIVRMAAEASAFKSVTSEVVENEPTAEEVAARHESVRAQVEQIAGDVLSQLRFNR